MKYQYFLFFFLLSLFYKTNLKAQETVNGGFQLSDKTGMARNWITDDAKGRFTISLSKNVYRSGGQSLKLDGSKNNPDEQYTGIAANIFGAMSSTKIKTIQISGWIKSSERLDSTVSLFVQLGSKIIRAQAQGKTEKGWNRFTLNFNALPAEDWYQFYYGVEVRSNRVVWLDDVSLMVNDVKINDSKSLYQEPNSKSIKWLSENLSVINAVDTAHSNKDLAAIGDAIKDAKIVGIGEPTHGTSEATRFKIRLLEYLVNEKGFTTIALEESIPTCDQMNRLVNLPSAALKDSLLRMPFYKLWKTEEMAGLFSWIQQYNSLHEVKVRFIGIDMEDLGLKNSRNMLRTYGRLHSESILTQTIDIDRNLDSLLESSKTSMTSDKTLELANRLKQKISALDALVLEEGRKTGDEVGMFALRSYARVCMQWVESRFFYGNRDEFMAENIHIFLKTNRNDKILLWAHNFHIANTDEGGQKTMGAFLKDKFSDAYFPIAITTAGGSFMAAENATQKKWQLYPIEQAYKGTYEYILAKVKPDNYFLDLLKANQHSNSSWLNMPMRQLDLGYLYSNEDHYKYHGTLKRNFDGVVFLRQTVASTSLLK